MRKGKNKHKKQIPSYDKMKAVRKLVPPIALSHSQSAHIHKIGPDGLHSQRSMSCTPVLKETYLYKVIALRDGS